MVKVKMFHGCVYKTANNIWAKVSQCLGSQALRLQMDRVAYSSDARGKMFLQKLKEGLRVHFLYFSSLDLGLLRYDEAVTLAEYVELHHCLPSSRPIEPVLPGFSTQPAPCCAYTNHTSM